MTSKEALEELYKEREYLLGEKVNNKTKNWHNDITHYDNINHCLLTINQDLDQLEEYRKLEEEIGIDFITLVKMLKDDVYINDGGIVDEIGNIYKEQVKSIEHWLVWGFSVGDDEVKTFYQFNERGKTWALDKEEFYKNIK